MAFPDSGNSTAATCGQILEGMLNQNLINSVHTSPTATFVEIAVIRWLRSVVGFKNQKLRDINDLGGIAITGGTLANTIAVLLARENKFPETIKKGLNNNKPLKMFIPSGISHYTSKAAMGWLGIGTNNVVEIKTNKNFVMDKEDLVRKIEGSLKDSTPFLLVAYAGDSRTMAIDDFETLSKIAKRYHLWFHIDACHGASLCFSDKLKYKVKGINLADSVTLDPHKVLFVPYCLSYLLVKNPKKFENITEVSDLITKEKYSIGRITPFLGSKSFDSLKFWFLIKHLGKRKIGRLIEKRHEMTKYFASLLNKKSSFYLMNDLIINSAAYLYVPEELFALLGTIKRDKAIDIINELNLRIQCRIFKEGRFYIHTFKLNDFKNVLGAGEDKVFQMQRLMLGNPLTTKKVLNYFFNYLESISKTEWGKLKKINKI